MYKIPRPVGGLLIRVLAQHKYHTVILGGSLPAYPVNDRRVAYAVTLKSTFCLPLNQQLLFKII